ncbi:MAG: hypothetical protein K6E50_15880 [Lachnospiraceae bacterium]|nr:hypothetical protein [Lachnospiraceae bacterium]
MKQFIAFSKLELMNIFGINVLRHEKDPRIKKRKTAMTILFGLVALMMAAYLAGSAYGLTMLGIGDRIPLCFALITSVFILVFGALKAKSQLYRDKDLELLSSLPVSSLPIVMARLLRSYVENLLFGAIAILPTFLICGIFGGLGAGFYLNLVLALLLLPVLPTALAAWVGIVFSAIIARNRHKVLTEVLLMLILVTATFLLPVLIPGADNGFSVRMDGNNTEALKEMSAEATRAFEKLEASFPFLKSCSSALLGENIPAFLAYGFVSLVILLLTALVIGRNFFAISRKLFPVAFHREFRMGKMKSQELLTALLQKEAGRYFSSGIYVSNTIVGPVLAVIFAVTLGFVDPAALLTHAQGLPVNLNSQAFIPFLLGMIFAMMTPAASSISLEGKNWWILKSLPVPLRDILNAKLLFGLLLASPFYLVSELILVFTQPAGAAERLVFLLVPAVSILFSNCFGLFLNSKLPNFSWESELQVVKQSAAVGLSMLAIFVVLLPGVGVMLLPENYVIPASLAAALLIGCLGLLLYRGLGRMKL